jgi:hypothetical protein
MMLPKNIDRARVPSDFMFRLTDWPRRPSLCAVCLDRLLGVAMLSSVLRSSRALRANIAIMRAFVRVRHMIASNSELAKRLDALEEKYDEQFTVVFEAIRDLMIPRSSAKPRIGFAAR